MTDKDFKKLLSEVLENKEILKRIEAKLDADVAKELLSPKEVQELLKISPSTYRRRVKDEIFTQVREGGKVYVRRSEIDKLIGEGKI